MGLKIDVSKILKNYEMGEIEETCIRCMQPKSIQIARTEKICDDCLESEYLEQIKRRDRVEFEKCLNAMGIPERYRGFNCSNLEVPILTFKNNFSYAIVGEVGTGKSNLACQILSQKRSGLFIPGSEFGAADFDLEKLKRVGLVCVDDITKVHIKKSKSWEKVWDFFNFRYSKMLQTIITTDKTMEEVEAYFDDIGAALVSRFREWMIFVNLTKRWR